MSIAMLALLLALSPAEGLQAAPPAPADEGAAKVVEAYRARVAALVAQHAVPKARIEEALGEAAKFDETVVAELAAKLKKPPEEIKDAWKNRERKAKKVVVGDGSWIFLGGQDGGLDSAVKGTPTVIRDVADDFLDRTPRILSKRKPAPPPEPVPLGKALKTKAEWWATADAGERRALLEAEYVRKSAAVERSEETKDCGTCRGKGTVNVNRGGIGLAAVCSRCHGAKSDLTVVHE
jgi:hypothetical protein